MSTELQYGLAAYYLIVAGMNAGFAAYYQCYSQPRRMNVALVWYAVAALFLLHSVAYFFKAGWVMPRATPHAVVAVPAPSPSPLFSAAVFAALFSGRRFFVRPLVAWSI